MSPPPSIVRIDDYYYITYTNSIVGSFMDIVKRLLSSFFDFLQGIVVILAIMVMVYLFIMSPQEISGASMFPTFKDKEYILTNKVEYKFTDPKRGDVVIFKSPRNKEVDYIKRIIGMPGETVSLRNSVFYINGKAVAEPYIPTGTPIYGGSYLREGQQVIVPKVMYFVIGDNRPHSSDSREFGPIAKEDFIGKALFRYWPFNTLGPIIRPTYAID